MKQVTINKDTLNEVTEIMCDKYCKWTFEADSQEALEEICNDCPLNNILHWPLEGEE